MNGNKGENIVARGRNYFNNMLLKYAIRKYTKYNKDELGIFTVIAEQLGFKQYPAQSMIGDVDASNFINDKDHVISMQYNEYLEQEEIDSMKSL